MNTLGDRTGETSSSSSGSNVPTEQEVQRGKGSSYTATKQPSMGKGTTEKTQQLWISAPQVKSLANIDLKTERIDKNLTIQKQKMNPIKLFFMNLFGINRDLGLSKAIKKIDRDISDHPELLKDKEFVLNLRTLYTKFSVIDDKQFRKDNAASLSNIGNVYLKIGVFDKLKKAPTSELEQICNEFTSATVNLCDENGLTPLHYIAKKGGGEKLITSLLSKGADINAQDNKGNTPLHLAEKKSTVELLVKGMTIENKEIKADVLKENRNGATALHLAAAAGNLEVCQAIRDSAPFSDALLWRKNKDGDTIWHLMAKNRQLADPEFEKEEQSRLYGWLGQGAENKLLETNVSGQTPIHIAIQKGNVAFLEVLCDPERKYNIKWTHPNVSNLLSFALDQLAIEGSEKNLSDKVHVIKLLTNKVPIYMNDEIKNKIEVLKQQRPAAFAQVKPYLESPGKFRVEADLQKSKAGYIQEHEIFSGKIAEIRTKLTAAKPKPE